MHAKKSGLWRHPDFLKLWSGETISLFGSQITALALPLTAALILKASPGEMGLLATVEFLPFLLLSLFAGVWVDRLPRKPILVIADIGRGILLGLIPAAFFLNMLSIELLYVVGFLTGVLTVFFDVAYQSYLPALVERDQLVDGNGKLEISRSTAQISGPGLSGVLVQVASAPVAILIDAVSYFFSAFFIGLIKKPEVKQVQPAGQTKNIWREIGEGLGIVLKNPILRSIAGCTSTGNLFGNVLQVVFTLYMVNELKLAPAIIGLIFAVGSVGGLVGAFGSTRIASKLGLGWTIIATAMLGAVYLLIPAVSDSSPVSVLLLMVVQLVYSFSGTVYNINQVSLRQAITPDRVQGRMNASMRFIVWGTIPVGALLGGFLGEILGLRLTLLIGAIGSSVAFLWVLLSPVRHLKEQPRMAEEAETAQVEPETLVTTGR